MGLPSSKGALFFFFFLSDQHERVLKEGFCRLADVWSHLVFNLLPDKLQGGQWSPGQNPIQCWQFIYVNPRFTQPRHHHGWRQGTLFSHHLLPEIDASMWHHFWVLQTRSPSRWGLSHLPDHQGGESRDAVLASATTTNALHLLLANKLQHTGLVQVASCYADGALRLDKRREQDVVLSLELAVVEASHCLYGNM